MTTKKINVDFSIIQDKNPYYLHIMDLSEWSVIKQKPSIIEITLPGFESCKTFYFDKEKVNFFNSNILNTVCIDECIIPEESALPDGIYTITVKGSPDKFFKTKRYLKTDLLEIEIDKLLIESFKSGDRVTKDLRNSFNEINFLLLAANSNLKLDNVNEASKLYDRASKLVEKLSDCK